MLEGPRTPSENEYLKVLSFLNQSLRPDCQWSIEKEYPTALSMNNRHNMNIVTNDDKVVSHAVLKPLIIKSPHMIYKLGAIGSVVTDENYRNQGLSKKIMNHSLDLAAQQQCDMAILWTNIYDFYRPLGFELAGFEMSYVFENSFPYETQQFRYLSDNKVSVELVAKLYSQHTVSTIRTLEEWKKYLAIPNTHIYTVWNHQGQILAYAIEGKGIDLKDYIHEWGGSVSALMNLLGYIREQKKKSFTLILPKHSTNLINRVAAVASYSNVGYLGMIKILNFEQLSQKIKKSFRSLGVADIVLEKHQNYILFGCGNDLCTIESFSELTQLLFGPMSLADLNIFQKNTIEKLNLILPLPLWVWGWDSV